MHKLIQRLSKISYHIPITVYLIVFAAIIIPGYNWLAKLSKLPDSAYRDIVSLLLSIALVFGVAILCFGFITVSISFIYFKWKQHQHKIEINLQTSASKNQEEQKQIIAIRIHPILLPLLGFMRVRLIYDKTHISKKYALGSEHTNYFRLTYNGEFNWNLPEIREYQIEKVIIYFEDFFQFFSFAITVNSSNRFYITPNTKTIDSLKSSPRKTEETTTRIEELKRVEGELINYKNFENNDDVRRIVWKIYAKNKELVVRIPETLDPFASHIYLYTSFYTAFNVEGNEAVQTVFLNYYKTMCWSVYKQLTTKGFEVRLINDQPTPANNIHDKDELVQYSIATSAWQNQTNLREFVKPGYASVILISSLSDITQVTEFIENFGSEISVVFIPLTDSLEQNALRDWVKWLFIENSNKHGSAIRTSWNFSPLRHKITENEITIRKAIKNSSKSSVLSS